MSLTRRTLLQAGATGTVGTLLGCGKRRPPGFWALPPLPDSPPGLFCDVGARWSHDGKRIAFLRATPDRQHQLFTLDFATRALEPQFKAELVFPDRPFYPGYDRYVSPDCLAWSPDDSRLVFPRIEWFDQPSGERIPGVGLWELRFASRRVEPLALHPFFYSGTFYYYRFPQWSPDGRRLAFIAESPSGQRALVIHTPNVTHVQETEPRPDPYLDSDWGAWEPVAPASDLPALIHRQRIQRVPGAPPTETFRRIRPGSLNAADSGEFWRGEQRLGHPAWSADGQWLAFTQTPDPNDLNRSTLWAMRRNGKDIRRISPADGRGYLAPVWIGNERIGALSPQNGAFEVVLLEHSRIIKVTLGAIPTADCDWSPDRRTLVYATPPQPSAPTEATTLRFFETGLPIGG